MAYHHSQQGQWDSTDALNDSPPPPPAHRHPVGMHADPNNYSDYSTPGMTPSDGMSEHSAGRSNGQYSRPMGVPENITPFHDQYGYEGPSAPRAMYPARSNNSSGPYASGGMGPGVYSSSSSMHSGPPAPQGVPYSDTPYNRYSSSAQNLAPQMGQIDPNSVADDDDWGMGPNHPQSKRRSFVPPFGHSSRDGSRNGSPGSSIHGGAAAAAAGGVAGASAYAAARDGGKYNAVPNVNASSDLLAEKSDWAKKNDLRKRKKRMWIAIAIITVILLGAILGGVLGAMLNRGGGGENGKSGTTADDIAQDNKNDLGKNSAEIKALMNNANLHKVFPGMDYTPLNAQYPDCMHVGPSQNNITRDMAVMSQLTNAVRLYGTDCNQTQMLIHAIDRLEIKDTMKLWLGVWLDSNHTTTQRQIDQTWQILDDYGCDYFKGIIIGNEVLFRKDLTPTELIGNITEFRKNITAHNCQLPVAMADLGDNWDADMASKVDVVMSNVHPFFAGVDVSEAAGWTWSFWQREDVSLTANDPNIKQIIAEVGWPSGGGKSCGQSPTCGSDVPGSVAGVSELNQFMEDWICPSLKNGTEYFWFSAFDEPWKIRYNEAGKEWEDKWGLMDINRNLKSGVKIPTCDGLSLPS